MFLSIGTLVTENITQPVKDRVSDFFNVGRDMIVGLWNGISDKISWLKSQVKGLVNIIKGWFTGTEGFDEHSPSKWAFGVGYYITKALGLGTESGIGEALAAAGNVINKVKSTMSGSSVDLDVNGNPTGASSGSGSPQYVFHIYARDKETALEAADATLAAFQRGRWAVST